MTHECCRHSLAARTQSANKMHLQQLAEDAAMRQAADVLKGCANIRKELKKLKRKQKSSRESFCILIKANAKFCKWEGTNPCGSRGANTHTACSTPLNISGGAPGCHSLPYTLQLNRHYSRRIPVTPHHSLFLLTHAAEAHC